MAPLTLRWEWRTFGDGFGDAEARLRDALGTPRLSTETYLVTPVRSTNVKIRDDLLDVKLLDCLDQHGLELWRPALKSPFPLEPATLASIFDAWSLPQPATIAPCASAQALVAWLADVAPAVQPVLVTKSRAGANWQECQVEVAALTFDGVPIRTLAVEMSRPEHLWSVVQELGLSHLDNENYVRALQRFIARRAPSFTR